MHRIRAAVSHTVLALLEAGLIAVLVVGLIAGTAFAAKGGGGANKPSSGSGTISLTLMDGASVPAFGGRVTFAISTTATAYPYVHLRCYQGAGLVLEGWQGFFDSALGNEWFYLGPTPSWSSGAADCTATLEKYASKGWSVLASTSFHVYE